MEVNNQFIVVLEDWRLGSFLFEELGKVGRLLGNDALMGKDSGIDYGLLFLSPILIIDLTLAGTVVLLNVIVFFHVLIWALVLAVGYNHLLVGVLTLKHLLLLLDGLRVDSRIEAFEDDICVLALHEALVHFLHYWRWVRFHYAYVVDTARRDFDDFPVH